MNEIKFRLKQLSFTENNRFKLLFFENYYNIYTIFRNNLAIISNKVKNKYLNQNLEDKIEDFKSLNSHCNKEYLDNFEDFKNIFNSTSNISNIDDINPNFCNYQGSCIYKSKFSSLSFDVSLCKYSEN